jgi:D-apionolactonase
MATVDGVVWSMNPQVHAFDDSSIIETPEAQADQVATAHHFAPGRPLFVGPVTLLPRYNPNVGGHRGPRPADERQSTLFAAAFTLSSLEQLSEAGIDAVTYYETIGPGGVMSGETGVMSGESGVMSRESGVMSGESTAQGVQSSAFPVFHVLADAAAMAGREVLGVRSNRPLTVTGLAAGGPDGTTLLVANTTPTSIAVELVGVPSRGAIRRLNAATAGSAGLEPALFRSRREPFEGDILALQPYETVRLEFAP